ncbi:chemotaxis protein CheW [Marinitoga aeolica]|uniref:Chemotaxis protein CheW n=1 Tax=Marinitoga aeolica TaxID=2809031 RepID=A0ABY8PNT2_9BACT|nr:chemotaxis protein CheW [Marinitoga aeolica]WGS64289.1 chemotaxis protein CheW [Marinitoga aeolica]
MLQFITIILEKEKYAIPMENVQEVIKYENIVKVPGTDSHIIGIINLRDKTIPIMNIKSKMNIGKNIVPDSKIVILTHRGTLIGIIIDDTAEMLHIKDESSIEKIKGSEYFSSVIKKEDSLYKVINIEKLFEGSKNIYVDNNSNPKESQELINENLVQILKFKLGNEIMAIPVENVQEIVKKPTIYSVPDMPDFVKGVTSLRGEIIQIIDLNELFKKENLNLRELIVIEIHGIKFGLHVEKVKNIVSINIDEINKLPVTNKNSKVIGIVNLGDEIITLLDLEKVFGELGIEINEKIEEKTKEATFSHEESKLFLRFKLLEEYYAIEIEKIREITTLEKDNVEDVVNIRGEIIPLIDLKDKFYHAKNNSKNVVIVKGKEKDFGMIVDEVEEIMNVLKHEIEPVPEEILKNTANGKYLRNVINKKDVLIFVIDVDKFSI